MLYIILKIDNHWLSDGLNKSLEKFNLAPLAQKFLLQILKVLDERTPNLKEFLL